METRVLVAGMPRAGSTWLYNVLRFCHINAGLRTYADYVDRYDPDVPADVHVVKIHPYDSTLLANSRLVFTVYRDIRDVIASLVRRELVLNDARAVAERTKRILNDQYAPWEPYSDCEVCYETMASDKPAAICRILQVLGIDNVDPQEVHRDDDKMRYMALAQRDRTTQLWPNHFTDGRANSFRDTLDDECIDAIEKVGKQWLTSRGYQLVEST